MELGASSFLCKGDEKLSDYESNIKINVDDSELSDAEKRINNLKDKKVDVDFKVDNSGISKTSDGLKQVEQSAKGVNTEVTKTGSTFKSVFGSMGAYKAIQLTTKALKEAVSSVKNINDAAVDLQMATNKSLTETMQLMKSYNSMAQNMGATTTEVASGASDWLRQGKSIAETNTLLTDSMVLSKIANIDSADATTYLTSAIKGYNVETKNTIDIVDKLSSIDLESATDAGGLAEAMSRTAVSADLAGVSMDKLLGYLATVGEVTQKSMSSIGESFKTIFTRFQQIKSGNLSFIDEDGSVESLSDVETVLNNIDIKLRSSNDEFRNIGVVLDEIHSKWGTLSSVDQAAVSNAIAGVRQSENFKVLMENYESAQKYAEVAADSQGTALEKFEYYTESIEAKTKSLQASFESLATNTFSTKFIGRILDMGKGVVDLADDFGLLKGAIASTVTGGFIKLGSTIKDKWGSIISFLKSPATLITAGIGAVTSAYSAYQQYRDNLISDAQQSSQELLSNTSTLDEQIAKVEELKTSLASGTLSEEESYQAKSQLLDIQNELISTYGNQAEGIDLVNGSLEKELALMNELSVANANKYLNENKTAIDEAKDQMTKDDRKYQLGVTGRMDDTVGQEIKKITDEFTDAGISLEGTAGGSYKINFIGDATDAETTINDFLNRMRILQAELDEKGLDTHYIDNILSAGETALSKNQKILDDYQEIYNTALQSEMMSKGFGEGKPATVYKEYAEAVEEYNQALLNGDDSQITNAKNAFDEVKTSVDSILEQYPEYESLFDEVGTSLDTATIKANDFADTLSNNSMSDVLDVLKDMKDVDLKSMNFDDDVTSNAENALSKIVDKAIELGVVSDDSSESISSVVDILAQLGYISSDSSNGVDQVTQSISDLTSKTQSVISGINAVTGALSGQSTGKSISLEDFNSDELEDYQSALEYVNGTMQLNEEKVTAITEAKAKEAIEANNVNKAQKQSEYLKNAGEIEKLRKELSGLTEGTTEYNDTKSQLDALMSENSTISAECKQYDLLTASINEATSAYQNWLNKQSTSESGDMFDSSLDAIQAISDVADSESDDFGRVGTQKYQAAVEFIVPNSVDKDDAQAVQSYINSIGKYFDFDENGQRVGMNITKFCQDAVNAGLMNIEVDADDNEFFNLADGVKMDDFAEKLGLTSEMVQAMFGEMEEFGGEFDWADEAVETVGDLGVKAYESAEALRSIGDNADLEIKMDVSDIDNVDDKISTLDETIQQMNDLKAQPDVDASQIEYANDIIQYCVAQKQELSAPIFMNIDTSQVDGELGEVIGLIQQLQSAKNELDIQASVGADTTEAQGKVDSLVSQIQSKDATIKATIGDVDTSNVDTILAGVSSKSAEMWVTLGVKDEAITGYTPENKTATVTYTLNSSAVDSYNPSNLRRTVTYTIITNGEAPKLNGTAHINGTAYVGGTANVKRRIGKALASGEWGVNQSETALVGELGQELIVYGNRYWTVGDNGAEFTAIPKGAIVFNHKQTEEIFKNGYVTSDGGRGHSYANGTAYVTGGINVSNAKKTVATGTKSYSSTTTKKSNTNTTSQAAQAATQVAEDLFDFVEIFSDRTKETTEKLKDAIDDAVSLADKMSKNSSVLTQIQNEISVNQQAYDKYIAQANSVGLSESYASQIRNGSLNIENITDEDLKKKIDDYKKWFEEAKKCEETIRSLQKDEKKLALDRLKYIEDYYDAVTKLNKAYQDVNNARIEFNDVMGSSAISNEVRRYFASSLQKQEDSYNKAIQQLADYQNETNELIANGYLQKDSVEYYDAMKTIQEFTKQVAEAATAVVEMSDKIRELDYTKLQQIIDMADRRTDQLKNKQSLAESRDQLISRDELQGQVDSLHKSLTTNYELREKKLQEQGLYDVTSTRYQELAKEIADIDGEIYGSLEDIEDIKNKIFENEFFNYEKEQDKLEYFIGELEDFSKLLNEDAYFDKTGAFTDEAYAKIALVGQAMSKSKQEISNATEALKKLNQMVESGLITQSEYDDKQHDLLDTIRSSVSATDDYKNELLDLYREQMQKENDYLQKNIEKRKEALKAKADYYDYDKKIKSSTKDINSLKAQIAVLEGTTNASSLATLKKLKADLAEKEESLADTKREHSVDMQEQGYNTLSDELNQALEDTEYEIAHSSEKQLSVVQSMLSQMVNSYSEAYSKINSIISSTGFVGTTDFNNTVENVGTSSGASFISGNATQDQSSVTPSSSATGINSDNITNDNHSSIESEIAKAPNIDNRPVAELKVTPTSVTLEEGKSTTVTTSIRPTDAKNKTLSWGSSDLSVATVSNGTIKAIKPGSCQIIISTTDGSGISVTVGVTVTKKPDPPKPTPPPTNNSGGDGVARVGDVVTLKAGQRYFYDSWGQRPAGNLYAGVPRGVVIDSYSGKEYGGGSKFHGGFGVHIKSADGRYGNLGWVRLDQLEGYATGDRNIDKDQLAWTQEQGEEIIVRKSDGAILTPLNKGDTVFNNKQVQRLWDVSNGNFDLANYVNFNTNDMLGKLPDVINRNDVRQSVTAKFDFDTLLTINGNPKEDVVGELRTVLPQLGKELTTIVEKGLRQDATKGGFKRRF